MQSPSPRTASAPTLTFWLSRQGDGSEPGQWVLERVTFRGDGMSQTIQMTDFPDADSCFESGFWSWLSGYLPAHCDDYLFSGTTLSYRTPGAIAASLRVMGQAMTNGIQRMIVSFRNFVGDLQTLFAPMRDWDRMVRARGLSQRTITEVLLPLLEIAELDSRTLSEDSLEGLRDRLCALSRRRDELQGIAAALTHATG